MHDSRKFVKKELNRLVEEGQSLPECSGDEMSIYLDELPNYGYQVWYTESLAVVKQLLPERLKEFEELYKIEKRKGIYSTTYTISDYLLNVRRRYNGKDEFDHEAIVLNRFNQQLAILKSANTRINSLLSDIKGVLRADIFDNEIEAA